MSKRKSSLAWCAALLLSPAAPADETIRVESGTMVEQGKLEVSGATTLVVPRTAKIARAERPDVEISARKQLAFDGQPPRSILMAHWGGYLGVMSCRDGDRLYLFPYGEWNTEPKGKKKKKRAGAGPAPGGQGASVRLRLSVPTELQVITNALPPGEGPCSAEYPSRFDEEPPKESYWYAHTAPPPKWTRIDLTPGRKK